jgi:glycosyltransferase involved in cell wall biosynthesis
VKDHFARQWAGNEGHAAELIPSLRLVSICLLLPYRGVDHAGGELLLHHYRVLAERCGRLDAFAIDYDENVAAATRTEDISVDSYSATILNFPRWRKWFLGKVIARVWSFVLPVLPDIGIYASFVCSKDLQERVRNADIVELQWYEFFYFARFVKRMNPAADVIGYVHDIPTQKIARRLSRWPAPALRMYLGYVAWLERQMLRGVDKVTVLSAKDADFIRRRSTSVNTIVLDPPLDLGRPVDEPDRLAHHGMACTNNDSACSFGFIGALYRPENDDAGLWLLNDIWPYVLEHCPAARLYLVGSKPTTALQDLASRFGNSVVVTGYVKDVDSFYIRFNTVVIPLRYGAGVKFKTISGILAGKNIIATPIAVEGTLPERYFFRVSDSAETLARAMVEIATSPDLGRQIAHAARTAVGTRYTLENYAKAVAGFYRR